MAESVWKLLKKFNFNIDLTANTELVCIICRNVLNNPHKSLCKCTYCLDCFRSYYSCDVKYCPGKSENCDQKIVDVIEYFQFDKERSNKVIELIVSCPIESCNFKTALKYMEQHISSHYSLMIDENENENATFSNKNNSQFDNSCLPLLFNKFDDLQMKFSFFQNKFTEHVDMVGKELEFLIDAITNNSKKFLSMKEMIAKKNEQIKQLEDQIKSIMTSQSSKIDLLKQNTSNYKIENEELQGKLEMLSCKLYSFNKDFNNQKELVKEIEQIISNLNPTVKNELQEIHERLDQILCNQIEFEKKQKNFQLNSDLVTEQKKELTGIEKNQFMNSNNLVKTETSSANQKDNIRNNARSIWLQKRKGVLSDHKNHLENRKRVRQQ